MSRTKGHRPAVSLIAAIARNGAIGRGDALLWNEPADQRHFRSVTMGCPVIMGRKTWDSLPPRFRPLPGRRNIVLTRDAAWQAAGAERAGSLDEALERTADAQKVYVIGGGDVYAQALPHADELVLTEIDADLEGDTFFPAWDRSRFAVASREAHVGTGGVRYAFVTYRRVR